MTPEERWREFVLALAPPKVVTPRKVWARVEAPTHIELTLMQGAATVHVQDGKALTERGAQLLGVPWTTL